MSITARPDHAASLAAQGLSFHAADQYWREDACYRFALAEIEQIEAATAQLHTMCVAAAKRAVQTGRLAQMQIPAAFWQPIAASLEREDFSIYGRLDLVYDGRTAPKLLEYNADTPTSLLESAVCQWYWLQEQFADADQFNSLHEKLVEQWHQLPGNGPVHMASLAGHEEDWACLTYLMDTLAQAGRTGLQMTMEDIGWDRAKNQFVDLEGAAIGTLFKLYPWEWMMREQFGPHIPGAATQFIEPMWKSVLSCKGLLPILWEMYPDHPNLLPAYFEPRNLTEYARKPLYSREGANIELRTATGVLEASDGPYDANGWIFQGLQTLPNFDDFYPVIGSWVVNGEPAGMGIREDRSRITSNTSHFVPHYFL